MNCIKQISKIIKARTILTMIIVCTFCLLAIRGDEMSTEFTVIATAVVTYYFCKDNTVEDKVAEHERDYHG